MTKFAFTLVATALLASASSAVAQEYRIPYGDLDLSSVAQTATFDKRVNRAARQACRGGTPVNTLTCARRFREEAMRQLPSAAREEYVRARRGDRQMAMVQTFVG